MMPGACRFPSDAVLDRVRFVESVGIDNGDGSADLKGTWVSVSPGSTSPYQDVTAGSYSTYSVREE
tara:strand:+ start:515 stop:712 length:198 start_codon:yes stop_codon:yes gene_type:complete